MLECDKTVRTAWTRDGLLGAELAGKTMGIVGFGRIGKQVARLACAFGMSVLAYCRNPDQNEAERLGVKLVELEELLRNSDIVTLHVPLTEETRGLIGEREFSLMKGAPLLINTARGPVVDKNALITALKNHTIAGACIDVFDVELLPSSDPLIELEGLILSPHIGFYTREALERRARVTFENIKAFLKKELINTVN